MQGQLYERTEGCAVHTIGMKKGTCSAIEIDLTQGFPPTQSWQGCGSRRACARRPRAIQPSPSTPSMPKSADTVRAHTSAQGYGPCRLRVLTRSEKKWAEKERRQVKKDGHPRAPFPPTLPDLFIRCPRCSAPAAQPPCVAGSTRCSTSWSAGSSPSQCSSCSA